MVSIVDFEQVNSLLGPGTFAGIQQQRKLFWKLINSLRFFKSNKFWVRWPNFHKFSFDCPFPGAYLGATHVPKTKLLQKKLATKIIHYSARIIIGVE